MAAQGSLPPSPPPLPLPALAAAPPHVFGLEKSHLLKAALERSGPGLGALQDIKRLLMLQKDRFRSDLKWILFCSDVPSLIQEGPQCGLVALWMAGSLLALPQEVPLEKIVAVALERGYTAQGEMFSAANMARLAEEVFGCQVELLSGGLGEPNQSHVFQHLISGCPLLVPYDEDYNHEPCKKKGHKAHWAVGTGLLLGVPSPTLSSSYKEDSELKGLFYPASDKPPLLPEDPPEATYLLSKQGKSWHYQLWDYEQLRESNLQLTDLAPVRTTDGKVYVVPAGGVSEGLCGHTLLLRP
ncbi:actin maturation protease isoform X1 [Monodelphis domestica]|uniref:actin maturation protease isoform X1 n=1 Tax=Monodelphis domestica TaxID=13616 RepID=UPI0024E1E4D3|nr:actin maturation protease isoform X1 [Monodelphis domestica]